MSTALDKACPRYFGAAAEENLSARVVLTWTGHMDLEVSAEPPGPRWTMSLTEPTHLRALNAAISRLPESAWRSSIALRGMELMASVLLGMGEMQLAGKVPSGHWANLTPRRMYRVRDAHAELAGLDLGSPVESGHPADDRRNAPAKQTSLCRRKGFLQPRSAPPRGLLATRIPGDMLCNPQE